MSILDHRFPFPSRASSGLRRPVVVHAPARNARALVILALPLVFSAPELRAQAPLDSEAASSVDVSPNGSDSMFRPISPSEDWLDTEGRPLPLANDDEILDFLRTAEMVAKKELSSGTTKPWKVTLERDGIRAHAIFRHVDVRQNHRSVRQFRDSYIFEAAAYEVDRLLGLGHVPPAVQRDLEGVPGSLQIWVENARSETDRIAAGEPIENLAMVTFQKTRMRVFDALISNFDRNTGNMLIDGAGKLWFVDHTRSFRRLDRLVESTTLCERTLWNRLRSLDRQAFNGRLRAYLDQTQIDALEKRRKKLLKRLQNRIDQLGEQAVIFDYGSSPPEDLWEAPAPGESEDGEAAPSSGA